jgi:hypothetical protein
MAMHPEMACNNITQKSHRFIGWIGTKILTNTKGGQGHLYLLKKCTVKQVWSDTLEHHRHLEEVPLGHQKVLLQETNQHHQELPI